MAEHTIQAQDKYVLRLPEGMRDQLKNIAAEHNRSMNAEIIQRLSASLETRIESQNVTAMAANCNALLAIARDLAACLNEKSSEHLGSAERLNATLDRIAADLAQPA